MNNEFDSIIYAFKLRLYFFLLKKGGPTPKQMHNQVNEIFYWVNTMVLLYEKTITIMQKRICLNRLKQFFDSILHVLPQQFIS